ncbi:hypothetical protein M9H77_18679 [Catharanthus roseus]|uniref:Uncharacterized protein n=1 Tax=Catharanthus roseus TaxID=4058 RepID=A0ACC0B847_CATRO|nr:hypothetical protein M9H77_18679 [Catharanthus roseus]
MWRKQLSMPSQRVAKEVEESIVIHVVEETSNEDSCDNMNKKEIVLLEKSEEELKTKEGTWRKHLVIFLRFTHKSISYPSLVCYEVSLVGLELFLESYLSHVSIYGDLCAISFSSGLFLIVPYVSKCLSSYVINNAFIEDFGYVSSFLYTLNHSDIISLNQLIFFFSNAITSLNPLFENTFGFKFYHLHFKEFLLRDFENQMETNLDVQS